jgi:predicted RNase H-like nuclease (RuvC/YqgF family)
MLQLFSRARSRNQFKARSADRDAETDLSRLTSVLRSIEDVIQAAEAELSGLTRRVDDALARASVTVGSGDDEYLTREALDSRFLDQLEVEISNGQRRVKELSKNIAQFKSLKADLMSRFPDFEPVSPTPVHKPGFAEAHGLRSR